MTLCHAMSRPCLLPARVGARPSSAGMSQGFTIIELMTVVAIVVVLIAIAGPDFRNIIIATRVKSASFDVFSSLTQARSEAITRNTTVTVTPAGGGWVNGWTITCADATVCVDPVTLAPPLVIRRQDAYQGITIANTAASISYSGMGRANVAASFTIDAPGASDRNKRCVTLDLSGRPVTKPAITTGFTCP